MMRALGARIGGNPEKPAPPGAPKPENVAQASEPKLSSRSRLMEALDYRDLVRNLTIENQLDDRHDLNGNSLYKLKFDAAVLPGANTQASAQITVEVFGPDGQPPSAGQKAPGGPGTARPAPRGSLEELGARHDGWRTSYYRWIDSLNQRLNQNHKESKEGYENGEFSHADYAKLINFLRRQLQVPNDALEKISSCRQDMYDGKAENQLPLPNDRHRARKKCMLDIVAYSIPAEVWVTGQEGLGAPAAGQPTGTYLQERRRVRVLDQAERTREANRLLQHLVNAFFASRAVRLVLGMAVPEEAFVRQSFYDITAVTKLARLTFFNAFLGARPGVADDAIFSVQAKVFDILAIEPHRVTQHALDDLAKKGLLPPLKRDQFTQVSFAPKDELRVNADDIRKLDGLEVKLARDDFTPLDNAPGVWKAKVEPGLLNFVRIARKHDTAFTYAVTPKETADTINSTISLASAVAGQPGEGKAPIVEARRELLARALERRPTVVGFAGVPPKDVNAQFGWIIAPRQLGADGQDLPFRQAPTQYSLSALVSVPAWWDRVHFRVSTAWIGADGNRLSSPEPPADFFIDLPTDFESLEALLIGIEQIGPELMDVRLDPVLLTACQPGAILIPGRRLWRSTKVTLGYQAADEISVLPNMKGIIAKFDMVQNPLSIEEAHELDKAENRAKPRQIQRTVRVWTSQGSLTLPTQASIGLPPGPPQRCADDRKKAAAPTPEKS
jgi:hypothetical protein